VSGFEGREVFSRWSGGYARSTYHAAGGGRVPGVGVATGALKFVAGALGGLDWSWVQVVERTVCRYARISGRPLGRARRLLVVAGGRASRKNKNNRGFRSAQPGVILASAVNRGLLAAARGRF
jgi:hypothetical protein